MDETLKVSGYINIKVLDKDGNLKDERNIKNLIPTAGKAGIASRLNGDGAIGPWTHIAVGTGTTAAAAGDTALQTEITGSGLDRAAATMSRVTTTVTNDTAQFLKLWTVSGTKAITECGIFTASSGGTILGHSVFSAINVASGDSLQITYKVIIS